MPQPINQWRGDTGLTSPPTPPPPPGPTIMFYYPPPPPPANIFHFAPGPYCSIPGPVGINALFTYPPLLSQNTAAPAQTEEKAATKEKPKAPTKKILIPPLPPPPAAAPAISTTKSQKKEDPASAKEDSKPKEEKKEEKKEDKKEDKKDTKPEEKSKEEPKKKRKVINTYLPPQIPVGTNFWFAAEFTQLHIFNKGVKIWEERWRGDREAFKAFTVDIHWPVRSIIERTRNHNNAETTTEQQTAACTGWAVTEVIEVGDNTFFKGTTVAYGSDKAKVSLASMGWNGKRGKSLPPVWLTVHKI